MVRVRATRAGNRYLVVARGAPRFRPPGNGGETAGGRGGGRLARRRRSGRFVRRVRDRWMCARADRGGQRLDSTPTARGGARPNKINRPSSGVSWCLIVLERRSTRFRDGSHFTRITKSFARVSSHEILKNEEARLRSAHAGVVDFESRATARPGRLVRLEILGVSEPPTFPSSGLTSDGAHRRARDDRTPRTSRAAAQERRPHGAHAVAMSLREGNDGAATFRTRIPLPTRKPASALAAATANVAVTTTPKSGRATAADVKSAVAAAVRSPSRSFPSTRDAEAETGRASLSESRSRETSPG